MTDATVARLHRALVEALSKRGKGALERSVTVAEIYQDLVPYRAVRSALGVELNADYEHVLVRLLAGDGGFVKLEPESAREELRRELEAPNPNVGVYRKFAACDVWVGAHVHASARAHALMPTASSDEDADGAGEEDAPILLFEPADQPRVRGTAVEPPVTAPQAAATDEAHRPAAPAAGPAAESSTTLGTGPETAAACAFCREPLPTTRAVRFCPFCGADQRHRPCSRCGEVVEAGWRFCIDCGQPVGGALASQTAEAVESGES